MGALKSKCPESLIGRWQLSYHFMNNYNNKQKDKLDRGKKRKCISKQTEVNLVDLSCSCVIRACDGSSLRHSSVVNLQTVAVSFSKLHTVKTTHKVHVSVFHVPQQDPVPRGVGKHRLLFLSEGRANILQSGSGGQAPTPPHHGATAPRLHGTTRPGAAGWAHASFSSCSLLCCRPTTEETTSPCGAPAWASRSWPS